MFSFITKKWRGEPLTHLKMVMNFRENTKKNEVEIKIEFDKKNTKREEKFQMKT